jgi:hypothetical protein
MDKNSEAEGNNKKPIRTKYEGDAFFPNSYHLLGSTVSLHHKRYRESKLSFLKTSDSMRK